MENKELYTANNGSVTGSAAAPADSSAHSSAAGTAAGARVPDATEAMEALEAIDAIGGSPDDQRRSLRNAIAFALVFLIGIPLAAYWPLATLVGIVLFAIGYLIYRSRSGRRSNPNQPWYSDKPRWAIYAYFALIMLPFPALQFTREFGLAALAPIAVISATVAFIVGREIY